MLKDLFIGQEILIIQGTLFNGFKGEYLGDIKYSERFDMKYCKIKICDHVIGFNPACFKFTDDTIRKEWGKYLSHYKIGD